MEGMGIYNEREHHRRMIFKGNGVVVDDDKSIIYANRWYVYINDKL